MAEASAEGASRSCGRGAGGLFFFFSFFFCLKFSPGSCLGCLNVIYGPGPTSLRPAPAPSIAPLVVGQPSAPCSGGPGHTSAIYPYDTYRGPTSRMHTTHKSIYMHTRTHTHHTPILTHPHAHLLHAYTLSQWRQSRGGRGQSPPPHTFSYTKKGQRLPNPNFLLSCDCVVVRDQESGRVRLFSGCGYKKPDFLSIKIVNFSDFLPVRNASSLTL